MGKPYTFDSVVRIIIGLAIIMGIYMIINRLSAILLPFLIGWVFAYILNPTVIFFQNKLKLRNRMLSVIAVLLLVAILLTGIILLLIPMISNEINKLSQTIQHYTANHSLYDFIPESWQVQFNNFINNVDLQSVIMSDELKQIAPKLWHFLTSSVGALIGFVASLVVFLYMFFILLDYDNISKTLFNLIPTKYQPISREIIMDIERVSNRYFRGQLLVALCVGVLSAIGFLIIGLPMAIVMGLLLGFLLIVPYMQLLSVPLVAILGLLHSVETGGSFWSMAIGIVVVYIVGQLLQDFVLTPKIMGKVTGLQPAIILLSLSIWGSLLGVIGLIIALPLTQLIISYYKRYILQESENQPVVEIKSTESPKTEPMQ